MTLRSGQVCDRYIVEGILGEGGMAVVYRVRHADLGSTHAMKVLTLRSPAIQERMMLEGRIQARVRHPNLVSVTDVARIDDAPALVLEFIEGPSLDLWLLHHRPTLAQADHLAQQILRGVAHAHAAGLVHRDLKPGNVLLVPQDGDLIAKVADFGLAKVVSGDAEVHLSRPTKSGVTMGTPTFMAPEQFRDAKRVDARADVFSLGAILYELVTGQPAFTGFDPIRLHDDMASERYVAPEQLAPDAPARMVRAIRAALRPDPDARVPTTAALLTLWRGEDAGEAWTPLDGVASPWTSEHLALARALVAARVTPPPLDSAHAVEPTLPPEELAYTLLPPSEPPSVSPVRTRWAPWVMAAAFVTGVGGALAVVVLGLGLWWAGVESPPPPSVTADALPTVTTEVASPEVAPEAPPEIGSAPDVASAPGPAPSASVPVAPSAVPPTPRPAAAVPPPRVASPTKARVLVEGVDRARLLDADDVAHPVGEVEPGSYRLVVFFEAGVPTRVLDLELVAGEALRVTCYPAMRICKR